MASTETDPRLPRLMEEARAIAAALAAGAALLDGGRQLDLVGLDQRAGRLCGQCLDLPPADGATIRPELEALRDRLDALAARLQASR